MSLSARDLVIGGLTVLLGWAFLLIDSYILSFSPAFGLAIRIGVFLFVGIIRFEYSIILLLVSLSFQSTATAITLGDNASAFNILRGTPFADTLIVTAVAVFEKYRRNITWPAQVRPIINIAYFYFATLVVFFVIGAVKNPAAALTYFRGAVSCVVFIYIGAIASSRAKAIYAAIIPIISWMILFSVLELFARPWLYDSIGMVQYLAQKGSGARFDFGNSQALIDGMSTKLLNFKALGNVGIEYARLQGPNLHAISFSYAVGVMSLLVWQTRWKPLALLGVAAMSLAGSKGAIITVLFAIVVGGGARLFRLRANFVIVGALIVLALYVAVWLVVGKAAGDYHVIGFLGGVKGFLANPIGHGLGSGGNLVGDRDVDVGAKWQAFQKYGADYGLESATGVLLYQIGVATIIPYLLCYRIGSRLIRGGNVRLGLAMMAVLANAFFQEEALLAPLGIGLLVLFAGLELRDPPEELLPEQLSYPLPQRPQRANFNEAQT